MVVVEGGSMGVVVYRYTTATETRHNVSRSKTSANTTMVDMTNGKLLDGRFFLFVA